MPTTIVTEQEFIDGWKEFDKGLIIKYNYTDEQYKEFYQRYLQKIKDEEEEDFILNLKNFLRS